MCQCIAFCYGSAFIYSHFTSTFFLFFLKPSVLSSDFPTDPYFWKDCEPDTEIPLQFLALLT